MGINWDRNREIADSMLDLIGLTPIVRLKKVAKGFNPTILGKLELFNPSGSLKDRIYHNMITKAMERGTLKMRMRIIETSTGNAGIACTFIGRHFGFEVTIVIPVGMSAERYKVLEILGANIITTPGAESDVDLCLEKSREIREANPDLYWEPGQYDNPYNVEAHYWGTGAEIWEQTKGEVDIFVATQGSGGSLTGIGRYLKDRKPGVKIFAVEPAEAPMLSKRLWGSHKIEGIGDGFVPHNLDLSILEGVVLTTSDEAIQMTRRLAKEEGILCGISSGSNVASAIKLAERYPDANMIVTMINDTGHRYLSTEVFGVKKTLDIPEREHPIDDYTNEQLDRYQSGWIIIE